eukprot:scaffold5726_cov116-Isochrysis_galbana.AAC.3
MSGTGRGRVGVVPSRRNIVSGRACWPLAGCRRQALSGAWAGSLSSITEAFGVALWLTMLPCAGSRGRFGDEWISMTMSFGAEAEGAARATQVAVCAGELVGALITNLNLRASSVNHLNLIDVRTVTLAAPGVCALHHYPLGSTTCVQDAVDIRTGAYWWVYAYVYIMNIAPTTASHSVASESHVRPKDAEECAEGHDGIDQGRRGHIGVDQRGEDVDDSRTEQCARDTDDDSNVGECACDKGDQGEQGQDKRHASPGRGDRGEGAAGQRVPAGDLGAEPAAHVGQRRAESEHRQREAKQDGGTRGNASKHGEYVGLRVVVEQVRRGVGTEGCVGQTHHQRVQHCEDAKGHTDCDPKALRRGVRKSRIECRGVVVSDEGEPKVGDQDERLCVDAQKARRRRPRLSESRPGRPTAVGAVQSAEGDKEQCVEDCAAANSRCEGKSGEIFEQRERHENGKSERADCDLACGSRCRHPGERQQRRRDVAEDARVYDGSGKTDQSNAAVDEPSRLLT